MADTIGRPVGYGFTNGLQALNPLPIIAQRSPSGDDKSYPVGQVWIDQIALAGYMFLGTFGGAALWQGFGSGSGGINTLTADVFGAVSPLLGNINIQGTGSQITTQYRLL